MPEYKYAQILSQFVSTMFVIAHLWGYRPFDSIFVNRQEVINEHMVLFAVYPLYCFTPWVWDIRRRMEAGWFIVFIVCFNIVFNISLLIYQALKTGILRIKYCFTRRQKIKDAEQKKL